MAISAAAAAGISAAAQSGIGVVGNLINWGVNRDLAYDAQKFNRAEAQKQRDWEQFMASTQYQRAVADMEAAGINPASMSGVNASPSAVPSGSSAHVNPQNINANPFLGVSDIINSALKGVLANDRNAACILAREIQDNAKHGFRMEELQEKMDLDSKLADYKQHLSRFEHSAQHADRLIELERKAELQDRNNVKNAVYKSDSLSDLENYKWHLGHRAYRK